MALAVVLRRNRAPNKVESLFEDFLFCSAFAASSFSAIGGSLEDVVLWRFKDGPFLLEEPDVRRSATIEMLSSGVTSASGKDDRLAEREEFCLEGRLRADLSLLTLLTEP